MKPIEYLESMNEFLASSPLVITYRISRQHSSKVDGYLRAIIILTNTSRLEVMEYVRVKGENESAIERYSYHWMEANNSMILRWDNAEHYPHLPGFPHHFHDGDEKNVLPREPMTLFKVLDTIATRLKG